MREEARAKLDAEYAEIHASVGSAMRQLAEFRNRYGRDAVLGRTGGIALDAIDAKWSTRNEKRGTEE